MKARSSNMAGALPDTGGGQRLPRHLLEATEMLREDSLATEVFGPAMLNSFLRYKVDEWERYHQAVTDWEVQKFLRLY